MSTNRQVLVAAAIGVASLTVLIIALRRRNRRQTEPIQAEEVLINIESNQSARDSVSFSCFSILLALLMLSRHSNNLIFRPDLCLAVSCHVAVLEEWTQFVCS
jgi:hypothetical protein